MDDTNSFTEVLHDLKDLSKSRDPRSVRLASVALALTDVIGEEGEDATASKVYASAVATLEGTLHQQHRGVDNVIDSLSTQVALLELLSLTLPHVAPATVAATMAPTSRVIRSVLSSSQSIPVDESQGAILDTKDELGAITFVLCSSCKAAAELLRYLPSDVDEKHVRHLLNSTLLALFDDIRPKVRKAAKDEICGLLNMEHPLCHAAVRDSINKRVLSQLRSFAFSSSQKSDQKSIQLLDLLGFLQSSIMTINFTSIGGHLMEMLLKIFDDCSLFSSSQQMFVAKAKDTTAHVLMINGILSTLLAMLEDDASDDKVKDLDFFAARVLASLVQIRPTLTFRDGAAEFDILQSGRTVYGQVILSAVQRLLLQNDVERGCRLLPLTIQHVLNLSMPSVESQQNIVADTLLMELSQLFRAQLQPLRTKDPLQHERCCSECLVAMQIILKPSFQQTWSMSLKTLAILLQQMDQQDSAVKACVYSMIKVRGSVVDETPSLDGFDEAFSYLIQAIGIECFWDQIELTRTCLSSSNEPSSVVISSQLPWMLKMMNTSGSFSENSRLHLSFFHREVLSLARHHDTLSGKDPDKFAFYKGRVLGLWSLFPCFCRRPADFASAFPILAPVLVRAMNDERYPELVVIISTGLSILTKGISDRLSETREFIAGDDVGEPRLDAEVLGTLSEKLLPSLFKLVGILHDPQRFKPGVEVQSELEHIDAIAPFDSHGSAEVASQVRAVADAIASLAKVAPQPLLQSLFSKVVQRLLEASQAEQDLSDKMCSLLVLSQALVISDNLDGSSIALLYRSLKPLIRTDETKPRIQKRAYKVLAEICNTRPAFVTEDGHLKELLELLTASSASSQVSARFMRLKCLENIVNTIGESLEVDEETVSSLLVETLLCLKDSNGKTRDAAYRLLLSQAAVQGGSLSLIRSVTAAIASKTSHMRSAAVLALSRLMFEYANDDLSVQSLLPSVLKTVLMLSDDPSREVIKSMVGFVRVSVAACPPEELQPLLPDVLNGLLKYHRGKDRFRSKIKIIIKKLVKVFGYGTLMPLVPESDSRLLTHMKKISEREARRKKSLRDQRNSKLCHFDDMVASDEEDSDGGRTLVTAATGITKLTNSSGRQMLKRRRRHARENENESMAFSAKSRSDVTVRLKNDSDGNVFDVEDLTKKTVRFVHPSDDSDSEGPIEFDVSGKLVVTDGHRETATTNDDEALVSPSQSSSPVEGSIRSTHKAQQKDRNNARKLGLPYKAKKAGGDVRKKGQQYDPYAYVPLDGRSYTKKNRRNAVEQMSTVVKSGRKRQKR